MQAILAVVGQAVNGLDAHNELDKRSNLAPGAAVHPPLYSV